MNKQHAYAIAAQALENQRLNPIEDLIRKIGNTERTTTTGPDGETYFLEIDFEQLSEGTGVRVIARVDLGNSFKLERIEECVTISID